MEKPTLQQRKAVFRTLFDIAGHHKNKINSNHQEYLMMIANDVLHLSPIEVQNCLSLAMADGNDNCSQISILDKSYQIEFRKVMYRLIHYGQMPTQQEIQDYNHILSFVDNRHKLPNSYIDFGYSRYNNGNPLLSWY